MAIGAGVYIAIAFLCDEGTAWIWRWHRIADFGRMPGDEKSDCSMGVGVIWYFRSKHGVIGSAKGEQKQPITFCSVFAGRLCVNGDAGSIAMVKKKGLNGYLTVEASLILSMVLFLYLSLIQSFLWIYDRCVLEQNLAIMVVRCVDKKTDDLEAEWSREVQNLDKEDYLWVSPDNPALSKKGFKLNVSQKAESSYLGDMKVGYELWRVNPCEWLRMKRKTS